MESKQKQSMEGGLKPSEGRKEMDLCSFQVQTKSQLTVLILYTGMT